MANNKTYKSTHSGEEIDAAIDKIGSLNISDYYNKAEVDEKLTEKIGKTEIGNDYYNKIEIDNQEHFEEDAQPAQVQVGNIKVGDKLAGLSLKTILKMMLYGEAFYPAFTNPNFNVEVNSDLFGIMGKTYEMKGILNFSRGLIEPAYETDGFRSGLPYRYVVGEIQVDSSKLEYPFDYSISSLNAGANEIECKVFYEVGGQPTDSAGAPYDKPFPAGELSQNINVIGLTPSFSGFNDDVTQDDFPAELIPIEDFDYEKVGLFGNDKIYGYQIKTPVLTKESDIQTILLPEGATIIGIQSWSAIIGRWDWFYGENAGETIAVNTWIRTEEVVQKEINGITVNYYKYQYNVEDYGMMDENYFRFFLREVE